MKSSCVKQGEAYSILLSPVLLNANVADRQVLCLNKSLLLLEPSAILTISGGQIMNHRFVPCAGYKTNKLKHTMQC